MLAAAFTQILRYVLSKAAAIIVSSSNYIDTSEILSEYRSECRVIPYGVSVNHFNQYDLKKVHEFTVEKMVDGIYDMYQDVTSGQRMGKVHS
jgi:hypothetical protein